MTLKVIEDQGHNMWMGWFQCQELVDFIVAHTKPMQLTTIRKDNHGRN